MNDLICTFVLTDDSKTFKEIHLNLKHVSLVSLENNILKVYIAGEIITIEGEMIKGFMKNWHDWKLYCNSTIIKKSIVKERSEMSQ